MNCAVKSPYFQANLSRKYTSGINLSGFQNSKDSAYHTLKWLIMTERVTSSDITPWSNRTSQMLMTQTMGASESFCQIISGLRFVAVSFWLNLITFQQKSGKKIQ